MRTEQAMFDLILRIAQEDDRIRAAIMNGSRANPNAPRDIFQDYDIVYLVTEMAPFVNNLPWIRQFGELMILQMPDRMQEPPPTHYDSFAYLAQFMDGNRIDLTVHPLARLAEMGRDSQSILLLDKDGVVEPFPPASERDYLPQPPSAAAFGFCCNEFWWVSTYVAKGLWRDELPYAREHLEEVLRKELHKMLLWRFGVQTGFAVAPGKSGKYLQRQLGPERWAQWLRTCAGGSVESHWDALDAMCALFRTAAHEVAAHFGYTYPQGDDDRVSAHLRHVRALPRDAQAIYPSIV
jgi:aminoglycoside 6-adenylyltransferase